MVIADIFIRIALTFAARPVVHWKQDCHAEDLAPKGNLSATSMQVHPRQGDRSGLSDVSQTKPKRAFLGGPSGAGARVLSHARR